MLGIGNDRQIAARDVGCDRFTAQRVQGLGCNLHHAMGIAGDAQHLHARWAPGISAAGQRFGIIQQIDRAIGIRQAEGHR